MADAPDADAQDDPIADAPAVKKKRKKKPAPADEGGSLRVPGLIGWTRPAHWPI